MCVCFASLQCVEKMMKAARVRCANASSADVQGPPPTRGKQEAVWGDSLRKNEGTDEPCWAMGGGSQPNFEWRAPLRRKRNEREVVCVWVLWLIFSALKPDQGCRFVLRKPRQAASSVQGSSDEGPAGRGAVGDNAGTDKRATSILLGDGRLSQPSLNGGRLGVGKRK